MLTLFLSSVLIIATSAVKDFEVEKLVSDPQVREGAILANYNDDDLYLLMGSYECFDFTEPHCFNDYFDAGEIWRYTVSANSWTRIIANNATGTPVARVFPAGTLTNCATSACPSNSIVAYGGSQYQGTFGSIITFDDFWYYDIEANEWHEIIPNNGTTRPGQLNVATIVTSGDYVYLFGGINPAFNAQNDLWRFDFSTNEWTLIVPVDGIKPGVRYSHRAIWKDLSTRNEIIVYGGNSVLGSSDSTLWSYNVANNQWTLLHDGVSGVVPDGQIYVGTAIKGSKLFVWAGETNNNADECLTNSLSRGHTLTNTVWKFKFTTGEWKQITKIEAPRVKRFAFDQIGNTVYFYGGFNYYCPHPGSGIANGHAIWNTAMLKWQL